MRTRSEVGAFRAKASKRKSEAEAEYDVAMYEGCVPESYWYAKPSDVMHNTGVFNSIVVPYRKRLATAYRNGYGLLFLGDNGVGKTMFMSYVLGRAAHKGYSVYYTTLERLDENMKRGFGKDEEAVSCARRLREMLFSDFLAIDEVGKDLLRKDSWLKVKFEGVLKARYDAAEPVMMATNLDYKGLLGLCEETIGSMLGGRFERVQMDPGDFRRKASSSMRKDMGYS